LVPRPLAPRAVPVGEAPDLAALGVSSGRQFAHEPHAAALVVQAGRATLRSLTVIEQVLQPPAGCLDVLGEVVEVQFVVPCPLERPSDEVDLAGDGGALVVLGAVLGSPLLGPEAQGL